MPAISCLAPHGAAVYELVNVLVTLIVFSPLFGAREEEVDPGLLRFVTGLLLRVFDYGGVDVGRISAERRAFCFLSPLSSGSGLYWTRRAFPLGSQRD